MDPAAAARGARRDHAPHVGGIFFVGAIMAVGTLLVLDACSPGGLIDGPADALRADDGLYHADMFQLFNVFNARSDEPQRLRGLFQTTGSGGPSRLSLASSMSP